MAYGKSQLTQPEVVRLELLPLAPPVEALLLQTGGSLQRIANLCVESWLFHHRAGGSLERLRQKQPVQPCPAELLARWRKQAMLLVPDINYATMLATTNWLERTIRKQSSPRSNIKRWIRVLTYEESHWTYQHPLPVRVWDGNAKIVWCEGGLAIRCRLNRTVVAGRRATSTPIELRLLRPKRAGRSAGHRLAWQAAAEIAGGKRPLAQSQLVRDGRKWFLHLTVEAAPLPAPLARDPARVLAVRPGRRSALRIHAAGISGGIADELLDRVSRLRRKLDERRQSWRRANPQAPLPPTLSRQLSVTWRHHSGSMCDAIVAEVVRALRARDYGRVLWLDGDNRTAALALAGRAGEQDRRELFPFELLRKKATKRLAEIGIEVIGRANLRSVKRRVARGKRSKKLRAQAAGGQRE